MSGIFSTGALAAIKAQLISNIAGLGASLVAFVQAAAGAVVRTVMDKLRDEKSLFDFMTPEQIASVRAKNFAEDVTAAVQAAVSYATPLGIRLRAPAGGYKFSGPITKAMSFQCPNIKGDGYAGTIFDYSALPAGTAFLQLQGGSGNIAGAVISGVALKGNAGTVATEIDGQCGVTFLRCQFADNARGILLNNKTAGNFGEFVVAKNCDFTTKCLTAWEYKRSGGNDSFHGSGLLDCTVNGSAAGDPVVIVGTGCMPYNAPLSIRFWAHAPTVIVQNNNPAVDARNCNWYGNMTLESGVGSEITLGAGTGSRTFLCGQVSAVNQAWKFGTLRLADSISVQSNGAVVASLKPYTVQKAGVVSGTAMDCVFGLIYGQGTSLGLMLHITLIGANYRYSHAAIVTMHNGQGGANSISMLANTIAFNTSGWGAATFAINANGELTITNAAPGFAVTALVAVTPIGSGML